MEIGLFLELILIYHLFCYYYSAVFYVDDDDEVCCCFSEISRKMKVPWCEYWEFLDSVVNIESVDGLQQFELYFQQRLRELIARRAAERERQERLQNTSLCHLMQLLNLSNSSPIHSSQLQPGASLNDSILQPPVCSTWPPSLARLQPDDIDAAKVTENHVSREAQILSDTVPEVELLNGIHDVGKPSDSLSVCSSDSFHSAGDDSDLEFGDAYDWPDDFDWQAVEPLFIYGRVLNIVFLFVHSQVFLLSYISDSE